MKLDDVKMDQEIEAKIYCGLLGWVWTPARVVDPLSTPPIVEIEGTHVEIPGGRLRPAPKKAD